MIWIKRVMLLVIGSLLAVVFLLALVYATFDESDYRRSLVWIADHVFHSTLQIDGPLSLRLSRQFAFSAKDVTLQAHDDRFRYSSKSFSIEVLLDHLLSGTLWVNDISISQLHLHITESQGRELDWRNIEIPPVIVARADFDRLAIEYQERAPGTLHRIVLDSLLLDDVSDQGPVGIRAQGSFEDRQFTLSGSLPPIADVLAHDKPNALRIELLSEKGRLTAAGTIVDPINGNGLDLQLNLETADSRLLLEWFGDDIPDLGGFNMTTRLLGSYDAPRFDDIDARLERAGQVELSATGSVEDVFTGEGLDLLIESHTQQPVLVSWLLSKKPDRLASLDLKGRLQKREGRLLLSGLDAKLSAKSGLSMMMTGDTEIYPGDHALRQSDSGIKISFDMPSTSALSLFNIGSVPDLGAASGQFRLLARMDALAVYEADVHLGSGQVDASRLQGDIGYIPLQDDFYANDIDLQVRLGTTNVKDVAALFGARLADIGSGEATLRVSGSTDNIRLSQVMLRAGYKSGLQLTANGQVNRIDPADPLHSAVARFEVSARAADLTDLSAITDVPLPELGALVMESELSVQRATVKLNDLRVDIGRPDQPAIRLHGNVVTQLHKGSTINVDYHVAVADLVAALLDRVPGYLGQLAGNAEISDIDGSWGIEDFRLQSTKTKLFRVDIHGGFDDLKNTDEVNISIDLEVTDPAALGKALDMNLAGLAAYREQGRLSSTPDVISYHGNMKIGSTQGASVIHGLKDKDYPTFSGSLSIPVLDLTDIGFEVEQEAEYEVVATPGAGSKDSLFSREPFNVDFLNNFGLDIKLDIDEVESYGRYSINSVNGRVKIQNGDLRIDPLSLVYANGNMNMHFALQATKPPSLSLLVRADDLLLGPAMAQVTRGEPVQGRTNVNLDVSAKGDSAHAMASSLNGVINFEYENAKLPAWLMDYLSVDVFGWVLSTAITRQRYVTLNCVVAEFAATDGQLNSKLLIADGPNLTVGGRVDLDLQYETIDAVLLPRQKRRLFSSITPVRLSGPIRSPSVLAIPVQAAVQEIGALALSAPIYLSARFLETIWGKIRSGSDVGKGCTDVDKMTDRAEAASKSK
jgi:uncharacterized protein involved in outer membrane biogenesis